MGKEERMFWQKVVLRKQWGVEGSGCSGTLKRLLCKVLRNQVLILRTNLWGKLVYGHSSCRSIRAHDAPAALGLGGLAQQEYMYFCLGNLMSLSITSD